MKAYIVKKFIIGTFEALADSYYGNSGLTPNQGMHFCIQVTSECFGYELDGNTRHSEWANRVAKYFHVVILSTRNVFVAITDDPYLNKINPDQWKNTSTHPDCYREDGLQDLTSLGFNLAEEGFKNLPKEHNPNRSLDTQVEFYITPLSRAPFRFVEVKTEYIDDHRHFRTLTEVKELNFKLEVFSK